MGNIFCSKKSPKESDVDAVPLSPFVKNETKALTMNAIIHSNDQYASDWQTIVDSFHNPSKFPLDGITSTILFPINATAKQLCYSVKNNKWIFKKDDSEQIKKHQGGYGAVFLVMMLNSNFEGIVRLVDRQFRQNVYECRVKWLFVKRISLSETKSITGTRHYKHMKPIASKKSKLFLKEYSQSALATDWTDPGRSDAQLPEHRPIDNDQVSSTDNSRSSDEIEDHVNKEVEQPQKLGSKRQRKKQKKSLRKQVSDIPEQQRSSRHHQPTTVQVGGQREIITQVDCPQNCGLRNSGNSCYMNSILQCLCRSVSWKEFHDNRHDGDFLLKEFFSLMKKMTSTYGPLDTHGLRKEISKYSQRFATKNQQDAHEFLTFLLVKLSERIQSSSDEFIREGCFVQNNFIGQLQNESKFDCPHDVTTTQPFYTVSLPINTSQVDPLSVENCLSTFLEEEEMDTDAYCNDCRKMVGCTLKLSFEILPKILVLHLKKFDFFKLEKLDVDVKYPFKGLQISTSSGESCEYDLFGVCNHYGTLKGGHYTADVKSSDSGNWYNYSDDRVQSTTVDKLESQSSNAYILFYKQMKECTTM